MKQEDKKIALVALEIQCQVLQDQRKILDELLDLAIEQNLIDLLKHRISENEKELNQHTLSARSLADV